MKFNSVELVEIYEPTSRQPGDSGTVQAREVIVINTDSCYLPERKSAPISDLG